MSDASFQTVGVTLAFLAGFFVGSSLVLQKKGLLKTRHIVLETGNEHAYLKSGFWWMGMVCMILGEGANFVAYAFAPAIIVAPLLAVSVVVSSVMSVLVLKEKLNFTASSGIVLCIIGAVIIVLHGPTNTETRTIPEFFAKVLAPGFLVYSGLVLIILLYMVFKVGPKYGHVHPAVFLTITAIGGSYLVSSAQGFGASIVYSIENWQTDNQLLLWPFYPLGVFVICTALFQVNYLNKALAHFSASIVTPLNYVFFSFATMATTAVLYQGFDVQDAKTGITLLLGFLVIVIGVSLLFQYNLKVNKMTISRNVEDINDEEFNIEQLDVNPISLMAQTFPLHPETSRRNSKMSQRKPSHIENSSVLEKSEYVRHESTIKPTIVVNEPTNVQPILPVVSISQQIQQRLEINNLHRMPRISESASQNEQSTSLNNTPAYSNFPEVQLEVKTDPDKPQADYSQFNQGSKTQT